MTMPPHLVCDGCGQLASDQHSARRLERLQWATRYRPVHIQTLLLSGVSPINQSCFLYAPNDPFEGETTALLAALQIFSEGKSRDNVLTEVQKRGLFLTHILECPLESSSGKGPLLADLLRRQLPATFARIRRSLKPKRIVLLTGELTPVFSDLREASLGIPLITNGDAPFILDEHVSAPTLEAFRRSVIA